jgi:ethanolamine-phosphate cytidylyltransferase
MPLSYDPYAAPKEMGILQKISSHAFGDVNAGTIVQRIMKSRDLYEERQRKKGVKASIEAAARQREILEEEQLQKEQERASSG